MLAIFPRAANPPVYDRWLALLEEVGYRFRDVREINGLDGRDLLLAVTAAGSVALAPAGFALANGNEGLVVALPLDPPLAMDDTVVAWLAPAPRRVLGIVGIVREVARELRGPLGDGARGSGRELRPAANRRGA